MKKFVIATSLLLAACAASTPAPIKVAPGAQPSASSSNASQTGTLTQSDLDAQALAAQSGQNGKVSGDSVYFDYDASSIRPEYAKVIQKHVDDMKAHPEEVVTLEGNTDERGSDEFNIALGESRAFAVRKMMLDLGIPVSRIKTISFGAQKPRLTCHEESCWKENRRVDFAYKPADQTGSR
jgi:peptidoglycan-associated lipoprotein